MPEVFALAGVPPPPRRRPPLGPVVAAALGVAVLVAYPFVAAGAFERWGVRSVAAVLLGMSLASLALSRWRLRGGPAAGAAPALGVALLAACAVVRNDRLFLLLLPSWGYVVAAGIFWRSLADGSSLIERGAKLVHPYAPDFIRSYCRKVTVAWAVFLLANAGIFAWLAIASPIAAWESYTRWGVYAAMLLASAVEFVIRKSWFRYYPYGGPIDRIFAALLPSENTAAGRRSRAYILEMRRKLVGDDPPGERAHP